MRSMKQEKGSSDLIGALRDLRHALSAFSLFRTAAVLGVEAPVLVPYLRGLETRVRGSRESIVAPTSTVSVEEEWQAWLSGSSLGSAGDDQKDVPLPGNGERDLPDLDSDDDDVEELGHLPTLPPRAREAFPHRTWTLRSVFDEVSYLRSSTSTHLLSAANERVSLESLANGDASRKKKARVYLFDKADNHDATDSVTRDVAVCCLRVDLNRLQMSPLSATSRRWTLLVAAVTLFCVISTPLHIGFNKRGHSSRSSTTLLVMDAISDMVFAADVVATFRTGQVLGTGLIGYDMATIAKDYLRSWFCFDVIAVFPFEWIFLASRGGDWEAAAHWLRMLRVAWISRCFSRLKTSGFFTGLINRYSAGSLRLLKFAVIVVLGAHWLACLWIWIYMTEENSSRNWLHKYPHAGVQSSGWTIYTAALHYSVTTMTSVGFGDIVPVTNEEMLYSIGFMILTSTAFAFFTASIAAILTSLDANTDMFLEKLRAVAAFLDHRKTPVELQERVLDYFQFCYIKRNYSDLSVLDDLSESLHTEVAMFLNKEMLEKVPFLTGRDPSLIRTLLTRLRPMIFAPGDVIIYEGDIARDMYFIKSGKCEVVSRDGRRVYKTLTDGDFFGELALLMRAQRTASIRAVTYCDVFSLSAGDFESILKDYPESADYMRQYARKSTYIMAPDDMKRVRGKSTEDQQ